MDPQAKPEQPAPEIFHTTTWLDVPVTLAVNCCWPPLVYTVAVDGETVTVMAASAITDNKPIIRSSFQIIPSVFIFTPSPASVGGDCRVDPRAWPALRLNASTAWTVNVPSG